MAILKVFSFLLNKTKFRKAASRAMSLWLLTKSVGSSVKFSIPLKEKPSVVFLTIEETYGSKADWNSSILEESPNSFLNLLRIISLARLGRILEVFGKK